jgi:hypothetical protein
LLSTLAGTVTLMERWKRTILCQNINVYTLWPSEKRQQTSKSIQLLHLSRLLGHGNNKLDKGSFTLGMFLWRYRQRQRHVTVTTYLPWPPWAT